MGADCVYILFLFRKNFHSNIEQFKLGSYGILEIINNMAPRIRTIHDLYRKDDGNVRNTNRDGVSDDEASSPKSDAEI